MKPSIRIEYCPKCGWLLRAPYMAQELLTTFTDDLSGVMMQPSEISGAYNIYVDDKILFSRKEQERFPDIKELKQMLLDIVDPERSMGHSDKKTLKELDF